MKNIFKELEEFELFCRNKLNGSESEQNELKWAAHIITLMRERSKLKLELKKMEYMIPFNTSFDVGD